MTTTSPVSATIGSGRMEAFSDGVIAIIVTIMVLELKAPDDPDPAKLLEVAPVMLAYLLSFTIVAIYWVNHHHLLHPADAIGKRTLWLNIHWLFWLSLFPFATAYIGGTRGAPFAIALYAGLSVIVATAFLLLQRSIIAENVHVEHLAQSSRRRTIKNLAAMASMLLAIPLAWVSEPVALFLLAVPALSYFIPD
jgi:uncharacterized membrane protein